MKAVVLVPALNPDDRLTKLVDGLFSVGLTDIILVDDGSKPQCKPLFAALEQRGCLLATHAVNLGKGRALKTGMNLFLNAFPGEAGLVTADADGQHSVEDIQKVCRALTEHPDALILGARDFSQKDVPFKSRFGNKITRTLFGYLSGIKLADTQTGLRGIPGSAMPWMMQLKGERFEYEMNMLIECKKHEVDMLEVPIETIYIDENSSSHFNPLLDAVRIYALLGKFAFASISSSVLDLLIFALMTKLILPATFTESIAVATVVARVFSSLFNYTMNRHVVFQSGGKGTIVRYYILAAFQMTCSLLLVRALTPALGWDEVLVKFLVDFVLFLLSFKIQQAWVFRRGKRERRSQAA